MPGWGILRKKTNEHLVFLVIDNVQANKVSKEEAREYMSVEYNSSSKILVISRSSDVVADVLGKSEYCHQMPFVTPEEAADVFLQHVDPAMAYSSLTREERTVILRCMKDALFSDGGNGECYHPMSLMSLGVYFCRWKGTSVILWQEHLPEYGKVKSTERSYVGMLKVHGLQFKTLDGMIQLMFLDICLFAREALEQPMLSNSRFEDLIGWLADIHGKDTMVVKSKIYGLKTLGMLSIESTYKRDVLEVIVHNLYMEYANWFLELVNHEKDLQGVWCVGTDRHPISSLPPDLLCTPRTCWPDLERIRLCWIDCNGFAAGRVQEWSNVVVLQIVGCENLTSINLHGLTCLAHLELVELWSLSTLMFTTDGISTSDAFLGTWSKYEQGLCMLTFVSIVRLCSLERLPSFSGCTLLKFLEVVGCNSLTQPPSVEGCTGLERMHLKWHPNQRTLPSLCGLTSLRDLTIWDDQKHLLHEPLNLKSLGSLTSLRALTLIYIPVEHVVGLENLTHVEFILLLLLLDLTSFPSLVNVETSPLHVLDDLHCDKIRDYEEVLKSKRLIQLKLDDLARQGKVVPHFPHKI